MSEIPRGYLPPSIREKTSLIERFTGAVQTRIASRQKKLWSRFIGCSLIAEDITFIWPEENMRFFTLKDSSGQRMFNIEDLNLRELDEILKFLLEMAGKTEAQ